MSKNCPCFERMCKHYNGIEAANHICRAFQKGIPYEIISGVDEHLSPILGQENNIVFEKARSYADMEMFKPKRGFI